MQIKPQLKLTLVSANGRAFLARLPVDADGKVRVDTDKLAQEVGLERGQTLYFC